MDDDVEQPAKKKAWKQRSGGDNHGKRVIRFTYKYGSETEWASAHPCYEEKSCNQ